MLLLMPAEASASVVSNDAIFTRETKAPPDDLVDHVRGRMLGAETDPVCIPG